ncbi:helix-turn-helix domain-containing protein [Cytobacillus solani]|uniref:helix-turn-helix domain-containing protein n=1 Tax=Cytobacillus solani TaxID=1637975 RepID=UPI00155F9D19|nr:helix-turn-helix domain-containing protein [Cytobacillus solani]
MLTINNLKDRSFLYNITPEKLGTPFVESLNSYIARIAEMHCVSVGDLFSKIIIPILNKNYLNNIAKKGGDGFYKSTSSVNGIGLLAEEFVEIFSFLTSRQDIRETTLLSWSSIFTTRGLSKKKRHWCPCCYREQLENNQIVYDQLVWSIQPYNYCLIHNIELMNICPKCNSEMFFLERKSRPGYCSKCSDWLGIETNYIYSDCSKKEFIIGNMLINTPEYIKKTGENGIPKALTYYVEQYFEGSISLAAEEIGIPKTTLWGWIKGKSLPPLGSLIEICIYLNLSICEFLDMTELPLFDRGFLKCRGEVKSVPLTRKKDHSVIKQKIHMIIKQNVPMSLTKLAIIVGCDRRLLSKQYPVECEIIKQNYLKFVREKKKQRYTLIKNKVEVAITCLIKDDMYPSRRQVESLLEHKYLIKEKEVAIIWKELTGIEYPRNI